MANKDENYAFPWGFHLGDLHSDNERIPLYTSSNDGGFCLLYDKESEAKADKLLESLSLELLSTMPHESMSVALFDFGRKKFFNLSALQYIQLFRRAFDRDMLHILFEELEDTIYTRHTDLLCCNRPTITEHNQKSKLKKQYHLVLLNLENFSSEEIELRRVKNFVESAHQAGVYVIAFANQEIEQSESETAQSILKHFKTLKVTQGEFDITKEIFEFTELLDDHSFASLDLDKKKLRENILANANVDSMFETENTKLEL